MNLLSYKIFIYFNYLIFIVAGVVAWILSPQPTSINIFLTVTAAAALAALVLSKGKDLPAFGLLPTRVVELIVFINAILIAFSHFFLQVDNSQLLVLILIAPALSLLSLIFVNTDSKAES